MAPSKLIAFLGNAKALTIIFEAALIQLEWITILKTIPIAALLVTAILLSLPGVWIEALQSFVTLWWPWSSSARSSVGLPIDKLVHVSLFFVCGTLFVHGWTFLRQRWYLLCVLLMLFAVLTELIQRYVPGRSASVADLVADGLGIALGVSLALVYLRARRQ